MHKKAYMKKYTYKIYTYRMSSELSDNTKKQYAYMLQLLQKKMGKPIEDIIKSPHKSIHYIKTTHPSLQTQKAFLAAVCAHLKQSSNSTEAAATWCKESAKTNQKVREYYEEGKASTHQEEAYIPWQHVLQVHKDLSKTHYASKDHLLLAMYVLEPPKRQDYGAVKIVSDDDHVQQTDTTQNYLVVSKDKSAATLILNSYKTAKKYGKLEFQLHPNLVKIIVTSLRVHPRDFLFVDSKNRPYNDTSFAKLTSRIFNKLFKKNVTVNTLRHSIIKYYYNNPKTTHKERVELCKRMCHSIDMQSSYAYDLSNE